MCTHTQNTHTHTTYANMNTYTHWYTSGHTHTQQTHTTHTHTIFAHSFVHMSILACVVHNELIWCWLSLNRDWLYVLHQNLTMFTHLNLPPKASTSACSAAIGYNQVRSIIMLVLHPHTLPSLLPRTTCAGTTFVCSPPVPLTPPDCWCVGVRPLGLHLVGQLL